MPKKNRLRLSRRQFITITRTMRVSGASYAGASLALVQGMMIKDAATVVNTTPQAISWAVGKIKKYLDKIRKICPMCGQKKSKRI